MGDIDAAAAIDRYPKIERYAAPCPQHKLIARADDIIFRYRYPVERSEGSRHVAKEHAAKNRQDLACVGRDKLLKLSQGFGTKANR